MSGIPSQKVLDAQRLERHKAQIELLQNLQSQVDECNDEISLALLLRQVYDASHKYFYSWHKMPSYDGDGWSFKDTESDFYKLVKQIDSEDYLESSILKQLVRSSLIKLAKFLYEPLTQGLKQSDLLKTLTQILNESIAEDKVHYSYDRDTKQKIPGNRISIDFYDLIYYSLFPSGLDIETEETTYALALAVYLIKYSDRRRKSLPDSDKSQMDTVDHALYLFYILENKFGRDKALLLVAEDEES